LSLFSSDIYSNGQNIQSQQNPKEQSNRVIILIDVIDEMMAASSPTKSQTHLTKRTGMKTNVAISAGGNTHVFDHIRTAYQKSKRIS